MPTAMRNESAIAREVNDRGASGELGIETVRTPAMVSARAPAANGFSLWTCRTLRNQVLGVSSKEPAGIKPAPIVKSHQTLGLEET